MAVEKSWMAYQNNQIVLNTKSKTIIVFGHCSRRKLPFGDLRRFLSDYYITLRVTCSDCGIKLVKGAENFYYLIVVTIDKMWLKLRKEIMYMSDYSFFLLKRRNNKIIFANEAEQGFKAGFKKIISDIMQVKSNYLFSISLPFGI